MRDGSHASAGRAGRRTARVGVDSYSLYPLRQAPMDTLRWARAHGADGVMFSGFAAPEQASLRPDDLRRLAAFASEHGLYLEWGGASHIPRHLSTWARKDLAASNRLVVEQAALLGATIVRSCSGGLMRWSAEAPPTETLLRETADALRAGQTVYRDHGVVVAIETHFEFTSHELVRLFEMCEAQPGDWLGICLDTMNLLTMLEEPVAATRRLLPWVVATHIKDGGLLPANGGLVSFTAPLGGGVIDLRAILALLDTSGRDITLSIEDHGGSFDLPIFDPLFLSRFPDLTAAELASLLRLAGAAADNPSCRPLPREEWPARCEARIAGDLAALRAMTS